MVGVLVHDEDEDGAGQLAKARRILDEAGAEGEHAYVDCAEYCALAPKLSARQSPFSASACDGCAKTCDECAKECEKFKDDKHMADCAKSCRDCAKACRTMIEHLKH